MTDTAHLPGCVASQRTQPLLDFWGKASPTNHAGIGTHSIVYHSLDVAAVGAERARQNPKYPTGSHPDQQSLFSSIA